MQTPSHARNVFNQSIWTEQNHSGQNHDHKSQAFWGSPRTNLRRSNVLGCKTDIPHQNQLLQNNSQTSVIAKSGFLGILRVWQTYSAVMAMNSIRVWSGPPWGFGGLDAILWKNEGPCQGGERKIVWVIVLYQTTLFLSLYNCCIKCENLIPEHRTRAAFEHF